MVSKRPYLVAGTVSFVIFAVGFLLGSIMINLQMEDLKLEMDKNELELRNIQLEMVFLDMVKNDSLCPYLKERIGYIDRKAWELGNKLVTPDVLNEKYFDIIKRRYSVSLIEDWLFSKELSGRCETNRSNTLYFFEIDSDSCKSEGYILDYLVQKEEGNNLHIFSIDKNLDEPIIQIITGSYNITSVPAIVVNGKKFEGFKTKDELIKIFCGENSNLSFCG